MTCFNCDEAYHYCCHTPRITIPKSSSKWYCNDCLQKQYKANISQNASSISASRPDTPSNTPALPPVLSPQVSPARGSSDQMDLDDGPRDKIDPNIPDASDWTSEQVYQYFARLFPKEAEVFRQQVNIFVQFIAQINKSYMYDRLSVFPFKKYSFISGYRRPFTIINETIGCTNWARLTAWSCAENIPTRFEASSAQGRSETVLVIIYRLL